MIVAGAGIGIAGVVLLAIGIPFILASGTQVTTDDGKRIGSARSPRFILTPRGLAF